MKEENILETALYIHIPFCVKKCLYCDFPSYSGKESIMHPYVEALCKEISELKNLKIATIYVGGGTPTYLSFDEWESIGSAIQKLDLSENVEFTVEGNPGTFTREKLELLRRIGVNRLSIGLQAWQNQLLESLGRIHKLDDFLKAFNMAREAGFDNINIDLMFGIPGQTIEMWRETLKNAVELNPEHLSCYGLIVEEGTPFYKQYENGELILPNEDTERDMYTECVSFLKKSGYKQYEISNFSKPGKECRHNCVYWNMKPYIGCGSGAHSYFEGSRYYNISSVEEYIKKIKTNGDATVERHINTLEDEIEEFIFMGLRMNKGISITEFQDRFHKNIFDIYGKQIDKFAHTNLMILNDSSIFLSERGMEVSNSIMCEFILTS